MPRIRDLVRLGVEEIAKRLPPPRVIMDRSNSGPYLSRWYLVGKPSMPDGSYPFDETGQCRDGMRWAKHGLGVYLHRFHRSDESEELHNHPWKQSIAVVLAGGYFEERRVEVFDYLGEGLTYVVEKRLCGPGKMNFIGANDFHRVDLIEKDSWSLFITWRKEQSWGFWDRYTHTFTPWREYIDNWRAKQELETLVAHARTIPATPEEREAQKEAWVKTYGGTLI